jgi:hypothetical protein
VCEIGYVVERSLREVAPELAGYAASLYPSNDTLLTDPTCAYSAEECLDPPEARNDFDMETLRMYRLMSEYIREHPQVWQSSTIPRGLVRWDTDGYELKLTSVKMTKGRRSRADLFAA